MGDFRDTIQEVNRILDKKSLAGYSFENNCLKEKKNYTKILYMKFLCVLAQYDGDVGNVQLGHLERIIEGCGYEDALEVHLRKALEFNIEEFKEFLSLLKDDELRYYFCIDGLILLSSEDNNEKRGFLAKIIEAFEITVEELKFLSEVSAASVEQSSERFEAAKELVVESVKNLDCGCYVKNFYTGMIIDSDEIKYYYSANGSALNYRNEYNDVSVIFENVLIDLTDSMDFTSCNKVCFRKCKIQIGKYSIGYISADGVGLIEVSQCEIKGADHFISIGFSQTEVIHLYNNSFLQCGSEIEFSNEGGLIRFDIDSGCSEIEIIGNEFKNCYGSRGQGIVLDSYDEDIDDSIILGTLVFKNNIFSNCRVAIKDEDKSGPMAAIANLQIRKLISDNNQLMLSMSEVYNCNID